MTEQSRSKRWLRELKGRLAEVVEEVTDALGRLVAPEPRPVPVRQRRPAPRRRESAHFF